jgi:hypothetical protein
MAHPLLLYDCWLNGTQRSSEIINTLALRERGRRRREREGARRQLLPSIFSFELGYSYARFRGKKRE